MSDDSKSDSQHRGGSSGSASAHPVHDVIQAFGGIRPMANKLGIAVSTVQGWKNRDAIPDSRHKDIREAARKHGVALSPDLLKASGDGSGEEAAAGESGSGVVEAEEVATGEPAATGAAARAGSSGAGASGTTASGTTASGTGASSTASGTVSTGTAPASSSPNTAAAGGGGAGNGSGSRGAGGGDGGRGTGGGDGGDEDVPPPPRVVERPRPTGWVPGLLLGAAVLALGAGGAMVLRDQWLPMVRGSDVPDPVAERFEGVQGELNSLRGRLDGLAGQVDAAAKTGTVEDIRTSLDSLSEQVGQLEEQVAAGTAAAGEDGGIAPKALTDLKQQQAELTRRQDEIAARQDKLAKQQDTLASGQETLSGKQDEVIAAQDQLAQQQTQLGGRMDELAGQAEGITKRLDTVAERLDTLAKRLDALSKQTVKADAFEKLAARVDGLKKQLGELASIADIEKTRQEAAKAARQAAAKELGRAMAVVQVQDALRDSDPYADTLAAARKRLPENEAITKALDTLAAHAQSGVPTRAALLGEFRQRAGRAVAVSAGDGESDLMTGVLRRLGDVVRVRPVGQDQSGSGAGAVLARAEGKLKARNLEAAIADVESLSGAPAESMAPWLDHAKARMAVDSAVDTLRSQVIAPEAAANGNGDGA